IAGVDNQRLPAYMRENHALIGVNLRIWRGVDHTRNLRNIPKYALLLAMVCPNMTYVAAPPKCRELFMVHMEELIHTSGFRLYAKRLSVLLFGGWKNKFPGIREAEKNRDVA
ncbi:hypothetical protein GGI21_006338, partial [Coemansia aciculifera]